MNEYTRFSHQILKAMNFFVFKHDRQCFFFNILILLILVMPLKPLLFPGKENASERTRMSLFDTQ